MVTDKYPNGLIGLIGFNPIGLNPIGPNGLIGPNPITPPLKRTLVDTLCECVNV